MAVIVVAHHRKSDVENGHAADKVSGSVQIVNAARMVLQFENRVITQTKGNLGGNGAPLYFDVEGCTVQTVAGLIDTARLVWLDAPPVGAGPDDDGAASGPETDGITSEQVVEYLMTQTDPVTLNQARKPLRCGSKMKQIRLKAIVTRLVHESKIEAIPITVQGRARTGYQVSTEHRSHRSNDANDASSGEHRSPVRTVNDAPNDARANDALPLAANDAPNDARESQPPGVCAESDRGENVDTRCPVCLGTGETCVGTACPRCQPDRAVGCSLFSALAAWKDGTTSVSVDDLMAEIQKLPEGDEWKVGRSEDEIATVYEAADEYLFQMEERQKIGKPDIHGRHWRCMTCQTPIQHGYLTCPAHDPYRDGSANPYHAHYEIADPYRDEHGAVGPSMHPSTSIELIH